MAEGASVEGRLARKYRQPRGVEQFGIEPIPEGLKTVRWYDLFLIIVNFLLNPGIILIGGLAVAAGLSFWAAMTAMVLGIAIAFGAYIIMATVGVDYGLPGMVATRATYGIRGSRWLLSVFRAGSSVYWFAFQTLAGALGITAILNAWLGVEFSLVTVSLVFAVLQVLVALVGYDSLKKLSRVAFPLKVVILLFLLYLLATNNDPSFAPSAVLGYEGEVGWQWAVLVVWINSVAAAWLSMITDASDFCRYSKTRLDMWIGTMAAAVIGTVFSAALGAYAAAATLGRVSNPFELLPEITTSGLVFFLALLVLVLDNWTINVLNLYTGGLSLANLLTGLGRFWTTLIVSVIGVGLSVFPDVVNGYTGFMTIMGNFFAPIAGVLIADYLFVKRMRLDVLALFDRNLSYWYLGGFNPIAVVWTVLGFGIYTVLPAASIQTLTSLLVTGAGYYVTVRLVASRYRTFGDAAKPGEQREEISPVEISTSP